MLEYLVRYVQLLIATLFLSLEFVVRRTLLLLIKFIPQRLVTWLLSLLPLTSKQAENDPDCDRNSCEIIHSRGYICEEHYVETSDGWILGLHRIPFTKDESEAINNNTSDLLDSPKRNKPVVFIMHGFLQSSEAWLIRHDSHTSLPFILAERGFDVWLGNNRGNAYSHKHKKYRPDDYKYWDFSLDELISIDIPSMLNYVLSITKVKTLSYIGFSQGSAQAFGSFSRHVELGKKINIFIALAPTTKLRGFNHWLVNTFIQSKPELSYLVFGRKAFLSSVLFWRNILTRSLFTFFMDKANRFLFGWNSASIDQSEKAALYNHIYSYSSVKVVVHWFQIQQSNRFQMYDDVTHGRKQLGYRPYLPPSYNISNIRCPIALFYGGSDTLPNTSALLEDIKPVYIRKYSNLEHLCFMWSKDAHTTIFEEILELLMQHNPSLNKEKAN